MRYVLLLFIFCLIFSGLDSISRLKSSGPLPPTDRAAPYSTGADISKVGHVSSPAMAPVLKAKAVLYTRSSNKYRVSQPFLIGKSASRKNAVRLSSAAVKVASDRASTSDSNLPTVDVNGAPASPSFLHKDLTADETSAGDNIHTEAPQAPDLTLPDDSLAQIAMPVSEKEPVTLAQFAQAVTDRVQVPFMADSIRNSLMDPHGVQFGGIAGLNASGATATGGSGKIKGKPLTGFALGVFADMPLKKKLSFRPSLQYAYEGYQPNVNGNRVDIHVAYLSTSLDVVYHTHLIKKRLFVGAGPYMAYAVSGTYTFKGINTDMQFGNQFNAGDNLRKMDYGAGVMAGLLLDRNFVLGAKLDMGFQNISPSGSASQIRTRTLGLSLLYVFRNKANMKTL